MAKALYRYEAATASLVNLKDGSVVTPPAGTITPPAGFATFSVDQYADNSAGRWAVYDNSTFGANATNMRIQRYMTANAVFGTGSAGATNGTSLRLLTKREAVGGNAFTAGMVDSKSAGVYYPRYGYWEFRAKTPHGHGLWPAWWMTARTDLTGATTGGADMAEWDVLEYFHGQVPGKNSSTLHGKNNAGTTVYNRYTNNVGGRTFFEAPTYTPQWHKWATEILPVTDSTGNTVADVTQPNTNVRFRMLLDDVEVYRFVDTSALYWTTNGGTVDSFWNIYIQGCQVSGRYVGDPDGPLAYSQQKADLDAGGNGCLISGANGACAITTGGYTVQRAGATGATATMTDQASTFEVDYFYCAKKV